MLTVTDCEKTGFCGMIFKFASLDAIRGRPGFIMKQEKQRVVVSGNLWLNMADNRFVGGDRIRLLEMIDELGSITRAAKAIGVSYKTAWDMVNTINNLAEKTLVCRLTGGKGGGGAILTVDGREVVRQFRTIQEEHSKFINNLDMRMGDAESLYRFLGRISMKVSARNTFSGKVVGIINGAVNAEVTISLKGGIQLIAVVTNGAIDNLGLAEGMDAYAIIKASSIVIGTDIENSRVSARNVFQGTITKIIEGPVNTEVDMEIGGDNTISAVVTHGSSVRLGLEVGGKASAMFKASSVIIGVS